MHSSLISRTLQATAIRTIMATVINKSAMRSCTEGREEMINLLDTINAVRAVFAIRTALAVRAVGAL